MSLTFDGKNLYLTFMDPEEKIEGPASLINELVEKLLQYEPKYSVAGKEKAPSTGTTHYHVFINLNKRLHTRHLEEFICIKTIRPQLEKVRNNCAKIIQYCKKGNNYAELGKDEWTRDKPLNKKEKANLMLNGDLEKLFLEGTLGAIDIIRAQKLKSIFNLERKSTKYQQKLVMWFKGETGEGKTRMATELAELFETDYWMSNENLKWYDGYDKQEIAIIDDFRKNMLPDWSYLLRLLDGYGLYAPVKGGFTAWKPRIIIITSPASPHEAFSWINKDGEEQQWDKEEQLLRRLTWNDELQVYDFPLWPEKKEQLIKTVEKFLGRSQKQEENAFMSNDWSIIEPEGFITPG
jgi:hypothetical protein